MSNEFNIAALKRTQKPSTETDIARADAVGEAHGFVDRSPRGKPGRKKSDRTGQVHAKVLPHVSEEIAEEALRRGVVQGVIIEEAWALYKENKR
ncbi:chromosome partitioning protein ParB (plasmid) [Agrobacterium rosae]|uniref:Chromosome partitioning protein ParB n=1 Tax=Agrobacterium rosae TaxID=1972867 RepID=A0AAW9FQS4_9HYPH|nr:MULTISPECIES: chromosome partitioning protein ParB [Agrobacterium]MDX8321686.1 chromosome partitioning protein ParB [Agrobacterium sp. rho-8.1]MDX8305148.1 chromosome partitioning protein ParB [Agrobacterium rosae]MDX8311431.1 chromosome partitioning protein ParB [Agrobacterium sp. rho-13.3]MDX8316336.1 chromosome partitioning protein ParB [Agrobacterium rosae]MDX8332357.1 chromosome partitioning protein ParB [Agrobacterium rosae]